MPDIDARMRQLTGTTAQWAADDIVLGDGEIGVERTDEGDVRIKFGNGVDTFSDLPYFAPQFHRAWQNVTAEIGVNTDYVNGDAEVALAVQCKFVSNSGEVTIVVDGIQIEMAANGGNGQMWQTLHVDIPPESTFRINSTNMDQVIICRLAPVSTIPGVGGAVSSGAGFPDRELVWNAVVQAYGGAGFALQLAGWPGMSSSAGSLQTPTYSTLNKATQIPREVRRAASGAANDVGWGLVVSSASLNSVNFPGAVGDSGFEVTIIGGIDANVSSAGTTDFLMGVQGASPAPANGNLLNTAALQWFGLYSVGGSGPFIGYKLNGGSITPLTSALPLTWGTYQGWMLKVRCSPETLETSWVLSELTAPGEWTMVSEGSSSAFAPGRVVMAPNWRARKTTAGDVLDLWITSLNIRAFHLGSGSL